MAHAVIDEFLCDGCEVCVDECPRNAVYMENGKAHIIESRCTGCALCVSPCEPRAITIEPDEE